MESKEAMLKKLGLKTMFNISDEEMPELIEEYDIFMNHVAVLEKIDTDGVEPLPYPYEIETSFLREDEPVDIISLDDVLKNAKCVQDNQIKVPKVVK
ncbi:Asp-tRNA(Asn)/Glu-tRNA(Gln) amidotransferase subunit GatC [uncultured Thomasclavelia sp.]|uniref:Asp-tRNA(Asn)/Glu-tRNA(Gln) amidotransferase subunit GatC n=1 Tax=uncultured Thomasclavelia sp. TaxID=3025759 RepID=UPI0025FA8FA5|nr:Asp-tRNA(Asn)/Glu-tRNA(Gln) amidotransferase subunit GatC [uncultured Thomasclavelia sp.]